MTEAAAAAVAAPVGSPPVMNAMTENASSRLVKALGRERGARCFEQALTSLGVRELKAPQDLLNFANELIRQGGVVEAVGRALKVSAILRGAVDAPRSP